MSVFCRFLAAKKSDGGTLRFVPIFVTVLGTDVPLFFLSQLQVMMLQAMVLQAVVLQAVMLQAMMLQAVVLHVPSLWN